MQLHAKKNVIDQAGTSSHFSNKNKMQTISKVIETNAKVHNEAQLGKRKLNQDPIFESKLSQLYHGSIENEITSNYVLRGLQIIISEDEVENSPDLVAELSKEYGIGCMDACLEEPISIIVDVKTSISFLPFELLFDRTKLKSYVRTLTKQAFKYETIWILVIMPMGTINMHINSINTALLTFCSAISKFPMKLVLRQVKLLHLPKMIFNICQSSSNEATLASNCCLIEKYIRRPFLADLNKPLFASQCFFLTKFPTINYMTAAFLLHSFELRELVSLRTNNLKISQSFIPVFILISLYYYFSLLSFSRL
jgi:hypothetical protein